MTNTLKTTFLLGLLTGLFLLVGRMLGGEQGMWTALIFAGIMNVVSIFLSDKIVLSMYGAKQVTQQTHPGLYHTVSHLASKAGLPMPKVYVMNMPQPNAFATGRDPNHAAVAVSTSLMQMLDQSELEGVIAHELAHIKHHDILISAVAATIAGALSQLTNVFFYLGAGSRSRDDDRGAVSPIAMLALVIITPIVATLIHLAVSRSREFAADEGGAQISGNPLALARALEKLGGAAKQYPMQGEPVHEATAHMFIVNPFRMSGIEALLSTHPPMSQRIARLKAMAEKQT
jgi:heat shock protein HtpX